MNAAALIRLHLRLSALEDQASRYVIVSHLPFYADGIRTIIRNTTVTLFATFLSRWSPKQVNTLGLEHYRYNFQPFFVTVMKKTYHLCLSAGDEIMFRDVEDYNRGFNCFAIALFLTDSTGLCESFMSTHSHQVIQTAAHKGFMYNFRKSYSMYFNNKYGRGGRLGEQHHFCMEIDGYHHLVAAMSYTLRNAVHHGVAPIPYAYPHCSANAIFRKEMGKTIDEKLLPQKSYYRHIGRRATFPSDYKMNENGVFVRESVLDIAQVENLFVTPRAFNYYMSRKSSEEWEAEQKKDNNRTPVINLSSIEDGIQIHSLDKMLIFENGKADYRKISDIELCTQLDQLARTVYNRKSVYQLTRHEKEKIAEQLYRKHHLSESQIRRGLAFPK